MTSTEIWTRRPKRLLVTGDIGTGKTTWTRQLVAYARAQQAQVSGLLSPAIFENGVKTGIALLNLVTGEQRVLARRRTDSAASSGDLVTQHWQFDPDVLGWGDDVLKAITTTDLLVIDELGPLELERGMGWRSALALLDSDRPYAMACVVVRPRLVPIALARWPQAVIRECQ